MFVCANNISRLTFKDSFGLWNLELRRGWRIMSTHTVHMQTLTRSRTHTQTIKGNEKRGLQYVFDEGLSFKRFTPSPSFPSFFLIFQLSCLVKVSRIYCILSVSAGHVRCPPLPSFVNLHLSSRPLLIPVTSPLSSLTLLSHSTWASLSLLLSRFKFRWGVSLHCIQATYPPYCM